MKLAKLSNVLKIFGGGDPSPEEREELVKEVLLMTLARASSVDANIHPVEVKTVQRVIKEVVGEDVSAADVRVAARSELFERTPLQQCLSRMTRRLEPRDRAMIAQSLAKVITSDVHVTAREVEFFDSVAKALDVTPAQLVGLIPSSEPVGP